MRRSIAGYRTRRNGSIATRYGRVSHVARRTYTPQYKMYPFGLLTRAVQMKPWTVLLRVSQSASPGNWYKTQKGPSRVPDVISDSHRSRCERRSRNESSGCSVLDPNRIPAPRDSGGRKVKSRCGSEGSRIRAYECPRWSARCRLQEDPQTTRHKAERHEEVRAHKDANRDTRLRTHASSVLKPVLHAASKTVQALTPSRPTRMGAAFGREKRSLLVSAALPLRE